MTKIWVAVVAIASFCACDAFKILVVFPFPSKSHGILGEGVVRLLANSGHEVTYITPFPVKNPHPNVTQLDVSDQPPLPEANLTAILNKEQSYSDISKFFKMMTDMNIATILNKNVQTLINDPKQTFDVVVAEWMVNELFAGLAAVFDCPYIWLSTVEPHSFILELIDDTLNPSYNPGIISAAVPPFSFTQRLKELAFHIGSGLIKTFYFNKIDEENYKMLFEEVIRKRGRVAPSFSELRYNTSLVLGNSHVSLGRPTRLPQNYKPVRGYHINPEIKPLPNDLQKLLDNAKNGLIFFSLGSNVKSKYMPENLKRNLLKVFAGLKQTVLWKFEENLSNLPSNVHIVQWAPQPSILAHPNCILFITHGGSLSLTEAVYFAKPIIGVPVLADQFTNVGMAINLGIGLKVDLSYDMADDLKVALGEALSSSSYTAKAKELSLIYHHRPATPAAELVHWVEHVVLTHGAPHLRSAALTTPWYQKVYLDLIAVILAVFYVLKFTISRLFGRKSTQKKHKVN
ncbi:hypothetical protein evm_011112 [Chilo suppressalis]|nr:hypothetical protein evm_011112 [Chilo suppressalis]